MIFKLHAFVGGDTGEHYQYLQHGLKHICIEISLLVNLHPFELSVVTFNKAVDHAGLIGDHGTSEFTVDLFILSFWVINKLYSFESPYFCFTHLLI